MEKPTVYIETTILSYLAARPSRDIIVLAHQQITRDWWELERKNYNLYISEMVLGEIIKGDSDAAKRRRLLIEDISILDTSDTIPDLARRLIEFLNLPKSAEPDALHLSYSIEYEMDYLLTWNCSHLANGFIISKLKEFELEILHSIPVIVTPEELMTGGERIEVD